MTSQSQQDNSGNDRCNECRYDVLIAQIAQDVKEIKNSLFVGNGKPSIILRLALLEAGQATGNRWVDRLLSWAIGPLVTAGVMYAIFGAK